MKSLYEYLIQEKLRLDQNVKETDMSVVSINVPKKDDNDKPMDSEWRQFELPYKKFIIYIDGYHWNNYHFACLQDFLYNLYEFQDDFEDFDPTKIILYASDDLMEAFNWYEDKLIKEGLLKRNHGVYQKTDKKGCYDSNEFFNRVSSHEWKEKDLMLERKYPKREDLEDDNFKDYINTIL